jgi:hypothetical protein
MQVVGLAVFAGFAAGSLGLGLRALLIREPDRVIARLIVLGLVAKLVGAGMRYALMADLYGGRGDFNRYLEHGTRIAGQVRAGSMPEEASQTGTLFMDFIAGMVFAIVPSRLWAGFLVFSLLSFAGSLLFFYAFRLGIPDGNHRLYAALVFFSPTMVFWPSSIGKEAWLVFALGVASYGAARVLRGGVTGYVFAGLGAAGAFMVRPHMGALFGSAFALAFVLRARDSSVRTSAAATAVGLVIIASGTAYAIVNFGDQLPQNAEIDGSQTEQILAETERRTSQGGSEYDSRPVRSIGDLGHALITVPFRPFPTEGHNLQAQVAGFEGVILLLVLALMSRGLARLPRALLRRPFVTMAAAYSLGFIIAFSNVGNFGILTRQRAQLLPFLFVLFALSAPRERRTPTPVLVPVNLDEQPVGPERIQPSTTAGASSPE